MTAPDKHGWRPIETAPKNGTEIIAWGLLVGDYGYTPDKWTWTGVKYLPVWGRWQVTKPQGKYFVGFKPTHWQPLPPPPEQELMEENLVERAERLGY